MSDQSWATGPSGSDDTAYVPGHGFPGHVCTDDCVAEGVNPSLIQQRPVLITFSVLAGLQVLTAGAAFSEVFGEQITGLLILAIAAVQTMMTIYVQGQVTPWNSVIAKVTPAGRLMTGPMAPKAAEVGVELPGQQTRSSRSSIRHQTVRPSDHPEWGGTLDFGPSGPDAPRNPR